MAATVYYLQDLTSRTLLDGNERKPAKLAVIGHPIAHSASPLMHQAVLDAYDIEARYIRLDIQPGEIKYTLQRLQELEFIGCNITVPHKLEALEACDELAPSAQALGAVNTILFQGNKFIGHNTDGLGFAYAIAEKFQRSLETFKPILLGAGGGAGQAIAGQCAKMGVKQLTLVNRSLGKIQTLATSLSTQYSELSLQVASFEDSRLPLLVEHSDLIINTTSLGLKSTDSEIIPSAWLKSHHFVYDSIYQPSPTPLLAAAQAAKCKTADGLAMLIHQGALAFSLWFPSIPREKALPLMRSVFDT